MKRIISAVSDTVKEAYLSCCEEGIFGSRDIPDFSIEVSRSKEHGDLAVNIAMVMAKREKKPPREIARLLMAKIDTADSLVDRVETAGAGFINFFLKKQIWRNVLAEVEQKADMFGASEMGGQQRVMVEFVSANPTGPLHIGHGRGAAVGDALAAILRFAGYDVSEEYYLNDMGNQMRNLGKAAFLRYQGLCGIEIDFPDELYRGDYIVDIARQVFAEQDRKLLDTAQEQAEDFFTQYAGQTILQGIKDDLKAFGVSFDTWFSEKSLFETGDVDASLEEFISKEIAYKKDGALWFNASAFGDEKDRVMVKEDGSTTYFASDIAYHRNKFRRGFEKVINIWGADHHGYVPRLKAMLKALGEPDDALEVLLVQMVNLLRQGRPVSMSTRSGEFVTLKEVLDEVGKDAARFIFLTRRADAQLDFDLDVAKQQSDENPVYYVQYAHARICSIIRNALEKGVTVPRFSDISAERLDTEEEMDLLKKIAYFPVMVEGSAKALEPHRVSVFLLELVAMFHSYYNKHRVISDDRQLTFSRLKLMAAIKTVLKNGLLLLGVSAPERM